MIGDHMIRLISSLLLAMSLLACATGDRIEPNYFFGGHRSPAGTVEVLDRQRLSGMKPIEIIDFLRNRCCSPILVEPILTGKWTQMDLVALQKMTGDQTPSGPVVSTNSSISCTDAKFTSTMGREAKHLIAAIRVGYYPLANCSTYDLHLDGD